MSLKILVFVFVACGYVIFSACGLDVQGKVEGTSSDSGALDKRDLKGDATHAKFLDPTPEYYRGPGSSLSYSERDRIRDRDQDGLVIGLQRPPYGGSGYDTRYPSSGGAARPSSSSNDNRYGYQDRIGYSPSSTGIGYNSYSGSGNNFGSSSSSRIPYGQPQPIDFSSSSGASSYGQYPSGSAAGGGYGGYSGYGSSSSGSAWDWKNKAGYPGAGHFFPPASSSDFYYPGKGDFAKSVLLPLAGAAILGLTAALVANPTLLHLGTLSGKRKRRDTSNDQDQDKKDETAQLMAYKAQRGKLI